MPLHIVRVANVCASCLRLLSRGLAEVIRVVAVQCLLCSVVIYNTFLTYNFCVYRFFLTFCIVRIQLSIEQLVSIPVLWIDTKFDKCSWFILCVCMCVFVSWIVITTGRKNVAESFYRNWNWIYSTWTMLVQSERNAVGRPRFCVWYFIDMIIFVEICLWLVIRPHRWNTIHMNLYRLYCRRVKFRVQGTSRSNVIATELDELCVFIYRVKQTARHQLKLQKNIEIKKNHLRDSQQQEFTYFINSVSFSVREQVWKFFFSSLRFSLFFMIFFVFGVR